MARVLIVGCGCRGRSLATELVAQGHAVRGTTRDRTKLADIEAAGGEAVIADPDRVGTLVDQLAGVTVLVHMLGSAEPAADLHGPRLWALLEKIVDSPVRGLVYEPAAEGEALVQRAADTWAIPVAVVPRVDHEESQRALRAAIDLLLAG